MDMVLALESAATRTIARPIPARWRSDERFADVETVEQLISAIRDCDGRSDELLTALVERGPADPMASVVVLASLLRLRAGRCGGSSERVDALAGELAVVLAEAWSGELPRQAGRRLANVMSDRAWGRVRTAELKGSWMERLPLDAVAGDCASQDRGPEDIAVAHVAVQQFREAIDRQRNLGQSCLPRAWDTAVELAEADDRSMTQRNQWHYARRVLRRHVSPDLELLDI